MFLPSPLTGLLVDRLGRRPLIAGAGVILLCAGMLAAIAPPNSLILLAVGLILLGLGWNLGLVAGTALLTDAVPLETVRAPKAPSTSVWRSPGPPEASAVGSWSRPPATPFSA